MKMPKEYAREKCLTLTREQYLLVSPGWCYVKKESWAALVDKWLGDDEKWAAKSIQNQANRGTDGTHTQGNRNHWRHKKVQEEKLKRPLSDMEAWELAHVRTKPKAGKGKYYGKSGEHL